ncbi:MAG: hypothetical protein ABJK43_04925 [Lentilitoribacter sp.]
MFAPTGYTALNSIFSETLRMVESHKERDAPLTDCADHQGVYSDTCLLVWEFVEKMARQQKAFILSPSGEKMPVEETMFEHLEPFRSCGRYIDISSGTLGSGDGRTWPLTNKSDEEHELFWSNYKDELFGPNLYCPVIMPTNQTKHFYDKVNESISGEKFDEDETVKNILDLFANDDSLTKTELKQKCAPHLTQDAFREIWAKARRMNPNLSRSGPRKAR